MSGLFGFSCKDNRNGQTLLDILASWNGVYGHEGSGQMQLPMAGLGCCIEHFSQEFPAGEPVLRAKDGWAVIDALLYNRDELLQHFDDLDSGISDEALLLAVVEQLGPDGLKTVNGDFSGAIYRENTGEWLLFRDHLGVRPLFVYQDDGLFAFSTDIRGLAHLPGADLSLNEQQLYLNSMGLNALSLTETEFSHIRCISPGCCCTVRHGETGFCLEETRYWTLGKQKVRLGTDADYINRMRELIEDSVRRRLHALPGVVGAELSGGLDSCVIDILINRMGRQGKYISWSPDPKIHPMQPNDERLIIQELCKQEGMECEFLEGPAERLDDSLQRYLPPYINTTYISAGSKYLRDRGARAVFCGHGGDEGVSHRCSVLQLWHNREYLAFFREKWQETKGRKLRLLRTAKRCFRAVSRDYSRLKKPWTDPSVPASVLTSAFRKRIGAQVTPQPLWFSLDPKAYIAQGGIRNRLDNVAIQGAENGVRYIMPFLDYRVMDFAVSIPRRLYRKKGIDRWIYREAFKDILPQSVYTLNAKDTPGMAYYSLPGTMDYETAKADLLSRMDWGFWSDYLDSAAVIQNLTLPKQIDQKTYYQLMHLMDQLRNCVLLQNICLHSGKRRDEDE